MATKRSRAKKAAASSVPPGLPIAARNTMGGPAAAAPSLMDSAPDVTTDAGEAGADEGRSLLLAEKFAGTDAVVRQMPSNANKAREHGPDAARPQEGATVPFADPRHGASTVTEDTPSPKVGEGGVRPGTNPTNAPLDRVRVDSSDQALTTNQGVPVADNQNSLKAGLRGPTLLEDFILREKITHFDHERIPERVVHARGSGAHGYFECYESLAAHTRAAPFAAAGKRTPVFVRFSTVAGERGSADTVRDARGFAVKFYTEDGNWDLVGNNMPVFFIQDAMKFPDLVHALKPEPHFAMPQASSAHDTFWDFVSLTPESTHMLLWVMSDRAIPRSYRMMQGFGVHTFRLVNAEGNAMLCKFHWQPMLGTHSLTWDEAVKISGADPDFHRRDLWEAIEAGAYPEFELGLQIFSEADAEQYSFDVLDATKIVPEEMVPVVPVGRLVLDRNPDNFFAETEQVAFCTAHVIPGIDFTNDPLLQGRIHSYLDTQLLRLGGPNFHEIPVNSPIAAVHNNQRDGFHRQAINRGRVAYEPNSLGGGCPFQAGSGGFVAFPEPVAGSKLRGKPERFADHYTQATLFWESQTPVEQAHIMNAFRFELTRTQSPEVRTRVVALLANVSEALAAPLARGLGMALPEPLPRVLESPATPEVDRSPALSLFARPGDGTIRTRRIAILGTDGIDAESTASVYAQLAAAGANPRLIGKCLGTIESTSGSVQIDVTLEAAPAVLFDALVLPEGAVGGVSGEDGLLMEFIRNQYRHCKPILALGTGGDLLAQAQIDTELPGGGEDPGLVVGDVSELDALLERFVQAVVKHRHPARETDPPVV